MHSAQMYIHTSTYHIHVYVCSNGRHTAETRLADRSMIINDADSLEEVLAVHANILPLAVHAREVRQKIQGMRK